MNKIRVLIADDERPAREYLKSIIKIIDEAEVIGEAENGEDAVNAIRELKPDVAILDLRMPQMGGLDVVRSLRKSELPLIIFATAYDEFAIKAFELNAVDYLLKPVEGARLREALGRASERLERDDWRERELERLDPAIEEIDLAERAEPLLRIPVKEKDSIRLIPVADVSSINADGELLHIYTTSGEHHTINFRLKDIESRLDNRAFLRISRGAIVNLEHVEAFLPLPGGTYSVLLSTGQELASSRLQSKVIRNRLLKM